MEWIQKAVEDAVKWVLKAIATDLGSMVMKALSKYLLLPMDQLTHPVILELLEYTQIIALAAFPALILYQALRLTVRASEGSLNVEIGSIIRRQIIAALALFGNYALIEWLMRFANSLIQSFLNAGTGLDFITVLIAGSPGGISFGILLLSLVVIIGWLVLAIQRAVLGAYLTFYLAIGPIAGVSISHQETPVFWNTWLRELVSLLLTYVAQTMMLWTFLRLLGTPDDSFDTILLSIGTIIAMYSAPKLLRDLTYNTGAGAALVGGGMTAGRMAVSYAMFRSLHTAVLPVRAGIRT